MSAFGEPYDIRRAYGIAYACQCCGEALMNGDRFAVISDGPDGPTHAAHFVCLNRAIALFKTDRDARGGPK